MSIRLKYVVNALMKLAPENRLFKALQISWSQQIIEIVQTVA